MVSLIMDHACGLAFAQATFLAFQNLDEEAGVDAPVFGGDCTRLEGGEFFVQMLAGPDEASLTPVASNSVFFQNGYFPPLGIVQVPGVLPGENAYAQIRVWRDAATYNEASIRSSSEVFMVSTGDLPAPLEGLESFSFDGAEPTIISHPNDQTVSVGGTAGFSVQLEEGGEFAYQWFQNGELLPNQTNSFLSIENVQPEHYGNSYFVMASNPCGVVASQEVNILPIEPPFILAHPQNQTNLPLESSVSLTVVATNSQPLFYRWTLNGERISPETEGYAGVNSNILSIPNATADKGGAYQALVYNDFGSVKSEPAIVSFNVPSFANPELDNFPGIEVLGGDLPSTFRFTNIDSTKEGISGEPDHAGNSGGKSAWLTWVPQEDRVVHLDTKGSGTSRNSWNRLN